KPSNIGLTANGDIKLRDFGLVTLIRELPDDEVIAGPVSFAGTAAYLPSEAFRGASPSPAFDLWGLAVTLFEAMTGFNPFAQNHGRTRRADELATARALVWHFDAASPLRPFFERAFMGDPDARFRDAAEIASQLEVLAAVLTRL